MRFPIRASTKSKPPNVAELAGLQFDSSFIFVCKCIGFKDEFPQIFELTGMTERCCLHFNVYGRPIQNKYPVYFIMQLFRRPGILDPPGLCHRIPGKWPW